MVFCFVILHLDFTNGMRKAIRWVHWNFSIKPINTEYVMNFPLSTAVVLFQRINRKHKRKLYLISASPGLVCLKSIIHCLKGTALDSTFTLANTKGVPDFSSGLAAESAKGGWQAAPEMRNCEWEVNLNLCHSTGAAPDAGCKESADLYWVVEGAPAQKPSSERSSTMQIVKKKVKSKWLSWGLTSEFANMILKQLNLDENLQILDQLGMLNWIKWATSTRKNRPP